MKVFRKAEGLHIEHLQPGDPGYISPKEIYQQLEGVSKRVDERMAEIKRDEKSSWWASQHRSNGL